MLGFLRAVLQCPDSRNFERLRCTSWSRLRSTSSSSSSSSSRSGPRFRAAMLSLLTRITKITNHLFITDNTTTSLLVLLLLFYFVGFQMSCAPGLREVEAFEAFARQVRQGIGLLHLLDASPYLWLARNEGMNPCSCPYITHYASLHVLFHSFMEQDGDSTPPLILRP